MIALVVVWLLLPDPNYSLAFSTDHSFFLEQKQVQSLEIIPAHQIRLVLVCFWGDPSLKVVSDKGTKSVLVEGML